MVADLEAEWLRRSGLTSLPEPDYAGYAVPVVEHVPVRELFRGQYGQRVAMFALYLRHSIVAVYLLSALGCVVVQYLQLYRCRLSNAST